MPKLLYPSKVDSNPGSLDCECGIQPLRYRAPQVSNLIMYTIILVLVCLSVAVSKQQVTILAQSSREMSQTVGIN